MSNHKQWKTGTNVSEETAGYNFTTLMMAVAGSSETPLTIYQTTFFNIISHIKSNIGTNL
jgi:hypothetical protein